MSYPLNFSATHMRRLVRTAALAILATSGNMDTASAQIVAPESIFGP
jgi:hypothetical protein